MAIIYSVFLYSSCNVTEHGCEVERQSFLISAWSASHPGFAYEAGSAPEWV
jgi:hypothetical protein